MKHDFEKFKPVRSRPERPMVDGWWIIPGSALGLAIYYVALPLIVGWLLGS